MNGIPLKVWFVNVGHGDCTIVKFPSGRIMMVDISNCGIIDDKSETEMLETAGYSNPFFPLLALRAGQVPASIVEKLRDYESLCDDPINIMRHEPELVNNRIFRFVLTHPDMDHMTGLYRLFQQEQDIAPTNFWDTANDKAQPDKMGVGYEQHDWDEYQRIRRQNGNPTVLTLYRGASGDFYNADSVQILSPTAALAQECGTQCDWNNFSQVLRIQYGKSSLLLPGDVEEMAQMDMLRTYGKNLKSSILKAPHHGRESGYCAEFAAAVNPEYTIVSVGKKPETDASNKYKSHTSKKVFSTRFMGTIYSELYFDGTIKMWNSPKKGFERIDQQDVWDQLIDMIIGQSA